MTLAVIPMGTRCESTSLSLIYDLGAGPLGAIGDTSRGADVMAAEETEKGRMGLLEVSCEEGAVESIQR